MKKVICVFLFPLLCFAQKTNIIKMKDAKIDNSLKIDYECETNTIVENDTYCIYEDGRVWRKFYPDMKTFRKYNNYFGFDKNAIYYKGIKVQKDTANFEVLGVRWNKGYVYLWKTDKGVYKGARKLSYNPKYFNVLKEPQYLTNSEYTYDEKNVYYNEKIIGADPKTIQIFSNNIVSDANNTYLRGEIFTYKGERIEQINRTFYKTSKFILTLDQDKGEFTKFSEVGNFKKLSNKYAIINDTAYYGKESLPIKKVNFKQIKVWDGSLYGCFTDGKKVYFQNGYGHRENLDAKTFGVYEGFDIYHDKNGIYYREYEYSKDKVMDVKIPFNYTSSVNTENSFVIDNFPLEVVYKNQIYQGGIVYSVTKDEIAQAKNRNLILEKIDGERVDTIFSPTIKKVGNKIYWKKQKTKAEPQTFKNLFSGHYYDSKNLYLDLVDNFSIVDGVDSKSIKRFGIFFKDKNYLYLRNVKIINSKNIELLGVFRKRRCLAPVFADYFFKNADGYWFVRVSREISVKKLDEKLAQKTQLEINKRFKKENQEK